MDKIDDLYTRVGNALKYFSDNINTWVHDYFYDEEDQKLVILLERVADRKVFCQLLAATDVVHAEDNIKVVFVN